MPALPDVPSVLRVNYGFSQAANLASGFRSFYQYSGTAPSNAVCNAIAGAISTAFQSDLLPLMPSEYAFLSVDVVDLTSPTAGSGLWTGDVGGGRSGGPVAVDAAVNLSFEIDRRYRGGKPKAFLPFGTLTDTIDNNNNWSNAFLGDVNGAWSSFDTAVLAITESGTALSQHVNVSYYQGFVSAQNPVTKRWRNIPTLRDNPLVDTIVSHAAKSVVGVQRRRRTSTTT